MNAWKTLEEMMRRVAAQQAAGMLPVTSDGQPMAASLFVCALEQSPTIGVRKHPIRAARAARAFSARFMLSWGICTPETLALSRELRAKVARHDAATAAMHAVLAAARAAIAKATGGA